MYEQYHSTVILKVHVNIIKISFTFVEWTAFQIFTSGSLHQWWISISTVTHPVKSQMVHSPKLLPFFNYYKLINWWLKTHPANALLSAVLLLLMSEYKLGILRNMDIFLTKDGYFNPGLGYPVIPFGKVPKLQTQQLGVCNNWWAQMILSSFINCTKPVH